MINQQKISYVHVIVWFFVALFLVSCSGNKSSSLLRIATTTSLDNSGLLAYLVPDFEEKYDIEVDIIASGTGQAIEYGKRGDVDLILVHAVELEIDFISEKYGISRNSIMRNDFIILGPLHDPAEIFNVSTAAGAFSRIANHNFPFVSRGDQSGTHVKEISVWELADTGLPVFENYISAGQGMGASLNMANEIEAYILADRGTYLAQKTNLPKLAILFGGETKLENPDSNLDNVYSAIAINPELFPNVQIENANKFIAWLSSQEIQELIGEFRYDEYNQSLFYPEPDLKIKNQFHALPESKMSIIAMLEEIAPIISRTIFISGTSLLIACLIGLPIGMILGTTEFKGRKFIQMIMYTGMGFPPVVVGLIVFLILSNQGPLSLLDWLFKPQAMIFAQSILAIPIATGLTSRAIRDVSPLLIQQIEALGASTWQLRKVVFIEAGRGIVAAVMASFGRIISEVGAVMLVGGNIVGRTRVMSTAIVLETRQGNFELALGLGAILLGISLFANMAALVLQGETR